MAVIRAEKWHLTGSRSQSPVGLLWGLCDRCPCDRCPRQEHWGHCRAGAGECLGTQEGARDCAWLWRPLGPTLGLDRGAATGV